MYQGSLLNVEKLMCQLKRIDKACSETEDRLVELKNENKKLLDKNSRAYSTIKDLTADLKEYKEKLHTSNSSLERTVVRRIKKQNFMLDTKYIF